MEKTAKAKQNKGKGGSKQCSIKRYINTQCRMRCGSKRCVNAKGGSIRLAYKLKPCSGQTTVEAAFLIPILLLLMLLLTQPMILLYNRMVMENAAAEGCRLLATSTSQGAFSFEKYEGYIKRRLASIPPTDIFHVHGSHCSWEITMEGNEVSAEVSVRIVNRVKPLPLLGWGADFLGMTDENNNLVQEVQVTMPTQPSWVAESGGNDPEGWVHAYD